MGLDLDKDGKITSFSGPIYGDFVRTIRPDGRPPGLIPSAFFKVVCFINKETDALDVRAFILHQDEEALRDKHGRRTFNNQVYQVSITEIEGLTGLIFKDEVYERNPLLFNEDKEQMDELNIDSVPERIDVDNPDEIVGAAQPRPSLNDSEVLIAAAMVNPDGNEREEEFVSILNLSNHTVDLKDWTLSDTKRKPLALGSVLENTALHPGQAVVINPITPLMLSNRGGSIVLTDDEGKRVDRVKYSEEQARQEDHLIGFVRR